MRRYDLLGKAIILRRVEGREKGGGPHYEMDRLIKGSHRLYLQDLNRAGSDGTFWESLVHGVNLSQK